MSSSRRDVSRTSPGLPSIRGRCGIVATPPASRQNRPTRRWRRPLAPRSRSSRGDRKSTRLNSSHQIISYAVFCLKKKKKKKQDINHTKKKKHNNTKTQQKNTRKN